jgi:hypothetical protein
VGAGLDVALDDVWLLWRGRLTPGDRAHWLVTHHKSSGSSRLAEQDDATS